MPAAARRRIGALDALRGFALCGIIFINIPQTLDMFAFPSEMPDALRALVFGRFYPIFFLLFGVGFGLFLRSAERRSDRPRVLLLRRFAALAAAGALLHLIQPGEVLLPFAVAGTAVLLPLSFAPDRWAVRAAVLLTAAGVAAGVGGFGLMPGLLAAGYALARAGAADAVEHRSGRVAAALASAAIATGAGFALVGADLPALVQPRIGALLALAIAAVYACAFLLLLRTPAGPAVSAALSPMGRLALTNYVTAALLFVPAGRLLGLAGSDAWGAAALLGAAILLVQAAASALWLRRYAFGPLEWAWRCLTYWQRLPLRRSCPGAARAAPRGRYRGPPGPTP